MCVTLVREMHVLHEWRLHVLSRWRASWNRHHWLSRIRIRSISIHHLVRRPSCCLRWIFLVRRRCALVRLALRRNTTLLLRRLLLLLLLLRLLLC